jgi:hypothetical protein
MKRSLYIVVLFVLMLALSSPASASDLLLTIQQSGAASVGWYFTWDPPFPLPDSATLGFRMGPTYTHTFSTGGPDVGVELPVPQELLPGMIAALQSQHGTFWLTGPFDSPPNDYQLARMWDEPQTCPFYLPCATRNPDIRQRGVGLIGYDIDAITYEASFGYYRELAARPPEIWISHSNIIRVYGTIPEPATWLMALCGFVVLPQWRCR